MGWGEEGGGSWEFSEMGGEVRRGVGRGVVHGSEVRWGAGGRGGVG